MLVKAWVAVPTQSISKCTDIIKEGSSRLVSEWDYQPMQSMRQTKTISAQIKRFAKVTKKRIAMQVTLSLRMLIAMKPTRKNKKILDPTRERTNKLKVVLSFLQSRKSLLKCGLVKICKLVTKSPKTRSQEVKATRAKSFRRQANSLFRI